MYVSHEDVVTPVESPHAYPWDWRNTLVRVLTTPTSLHQLSSDQYVQLQLAYCRLMQRDTFKKTAKKAGWSKKYDEQENLCSIIRANEINKDQEIRSRVDALLLCADLTYFQIATLLNVSASAVKAYEKLFYNVRSDEGELLTSHTLLHRMVLKGAQTEGECSLEPAGHWRVVAFESGHKNLFALWGWQPGGIVPEFTDIDAQVSLLRGAYKGLETSMRVGSMEAKDLASLTNNVMSKFEKLREGGIVSSSDHIPETHVVMKMLQLIGMKVRDASDASKQEAARKLETRLTQLQSGASEGEKQSDTLEVLASQFKRGPNDV